jgi:hypothetical protein
MLFWFGCKDLPTLSDSELDDLKNAGVDGFACNGLRLQGNGGKAVFAPDPGADLSAGQFEIQRGIRDSRIVERAKGRGMKLYMGFYFSNLENARTPLLEWFDDGGWSNGLLPAVQDFAGAARQMGFDGVTFDQELYPQAGDTSTASWVWNYPGNERSQEEVRAQVKRRGAQLMESILQGFPEVEVVAYYTNFPGTWAAVQQRTNDNDKAFENWVQLDLWDGLTSVEGYQAIRMLNAAFYKSVQVRGATWDSALQYEYNRLFSLLSRRFSNWAYASSRFYESPFIWIGEGKTEFEQARPPEYVAEQLEAFNRWGMGGEFANYASGGPFRFDYKDYLPAMQTASTPRKVSSGPPSIAVTSPVVPTGGSVDLTGTSVDELAVRAVRWESDRGGNGVAKLTWKPMSDKPELGGEWEMEWTIDDLPLQPGLNTISVSVESIKGLTAQTTLAIRT